MLSLLPRDRAKEDERVRTLRGDPRLLQPNTSLDGVGLALQGLFSLIISIAYYSLLY